MQVFLGYKARVDSVICPFVHRQNGDRDLVDDLANDPRLPPALKLELYDRLARRLLNMNPCNYKEIA